MRNLTRKTELARPSASAWMIEGNDLSLLIGLFTLQKERLNIDSELSFALGKLTSRGPRESGLFVKMAEEIERWRGRQKRAHHRLRCGEARLQYDLERALCSGRAGGLEDMWCLVEDQRQHIQMMVMFEQEAGYLHPRGNEAVRKMFKLVVGYLVAKQEAGLLGVDLRLIRSEATARKRVDKALAS